MQARNARLAKLRSFTLALAWTGAAALAACSSSDGAPGAPGTSCTAVDNGDGTKTITCGDDTFTVGDGRPGLGAGQTPGLDVAVGVSTPANGTHFVAGESIAVTFTLLDGFGSPLSLADLSTANLYMSGPRDPVGTRTAVSLLAASSDRAASQHHYVNLRTTTSANLSVSGNRLTYTMAPITTEPPGTYTVGLWVVPADHPLDQAFFLEDVQIGTAVVQSAVAGNCESCHRGGNGQMYLHHVDPSSRSPIGSPALDADPVRSCNQCHNQDGYAAVRKCEDGSIAVSTAGVYLCADGTENWSYLSDSTVHRVHGVHRGAGLLNPTNTDPTWGLFKDYTSLVFPADVRSCTTCHLTDSWKTRPTRAACGSCHDDVDFASGANHPNLASPPPNPQANDSQCAMCHGSSAIEGYHAVPPVARAHAIAIALSAPTNGEFYVDEAPTIDLTLTTAAGDPVDWTTVTVTGWNSVRLFVSGPRDGTAPALTEVALNPLDSEDQYLELRLPGDGVEIDPAITRAGNVLTYALKSATGLRPGTYTVFLRFRKGATDSYSWAKASFQVGTAAGEPMPASGCSDCHGSTGMHSAQTPFDTDICKSCHDYALGPSPETSTGWGDRGYGYGRTPLVRYVHQMHYGRYLTDTTVRHYSTFEPVVFPQDVRNCTSCHRESDAWNEKPSRLACTSCHDSAAAWVHATLETLDPTPAQPFSGDEAESCAVCHAGNADFAPAAVHDVADPYVPPYLREP